jgi:hypothetical protein
MADILDNYSLLAENPKFLLSLSRWEGKLPSLSVVSAVISSWDEFLTKDTNAGI